MDHARFSDRYAVDVVDVLRGPAALEAVSAGGFWAVVASFEGEVTAVRFADVTILDEATRDRPLPKPGSAQWPRLPGHWDSSLDETAYVAGVHQVRALIAEGTVYQVNLCRVMSHPLDDAADLDQLDHLLMEGNPAPHACRIRVEAADLDVVSASPELFLARRAGRLVTRPIKGTATTAAQMLPKDHAENVMIVDLMRNDISGVCEPGSVAVDELCVIEAHPGLVHLVSTVSGRLREDAEWPEILAATLPPGSVSGAPKSSALRTIRALERAPRGPYCGAVGWIDADRAEAELAVGIRTFWTERDATGRRWLRFGTGAGITWHSDPHAEWAETELKAARLIDLASGRVAP
ncbi:MAG TPA: chorismate-binding protein [Dermatophilaceae bacterium]|nr:chorismate-binding protein [Dermatophilaceae bacterium]